MKGQERKKKGGGKVQGVPRSRCKKQQARRGKGRSGKGKGRREDRVQGVPRPVKKQIREVNNTKTKKGRLKDTVHWSYVRIEKTKQEGRGKERKRKRKTGCQGSGFLRSGRNEQAGIGNERKTGGQGSEVPRSGCKKKSKERKGTERRGRRGEDWGGGWS